MRKSFNQTIIFHNILNKYTFLDPKFPNCVICFATFLSFFFNYTNKTYSHKICVIYFNFCFYQCLFYTIFIPILDFGVINSLNPCNFFLTQFFTNKNSPQKKEPQL